MKVTKRVRTAGGGASMTVRNLRIREDTAKYLRNLDLSSAYFDPKTRWGLTEDCLHLVFCLLVHLPPLRSCSEASSSASLSSASSSSSSSVPVSSRPEQAFNASFAG